jgi:hypothetical protein
MNEDTKRGVWGVRICLERNERQSYFAYLGQTQNSALFILIPT